MKALLACMLLIAATVAGDAAAAPDPADFNTYRAVRVRNIFDPTRSRDPLLDGERPRTPPASTATVERVTYVALVGTLVDQQRALGFFSTSPSEANVVASAGGTVNGCSIRSVSISGAEVERDGKKVLLTVGSQLLLSGPHAGEIIAAPVDSTPPPTATPATTMRPGSPSSPSVTTNNNTPPSADEVIRRLKERRRHDMKQ